MNLGFYWILLCVFLTESRRLINKCLPTASSDQKRKSNRERLMAEHGPACGQRPPAPARCQAKGKKRQPPFLKRQKQTYQCCRGSPDNTGTPESSTKGREHFHFIGSSDTGSISMYTHTLRLTNNPADLWQQRPVCWPVFWFLFPAWFAFLM